MNRKDITYPKVESQNYFDESCNHVKWHTYVRVKRNNKYYKVLVESHYMLPLTEQKNMNSFLNEYNKAHISFIDTVHRVMYLWQLPQKKMVKHMVTKGTLIVDNSHLSNKESFLVNTQIL